MENLGENLLYMSPLKTFAQAIFHSDVVAAKISQEYIGQSFSKVEACDLDSGFSFVHYCTFSARTNDNSPAT